MRVKESMLYLRGMCACFGVTISVFGNFSKKNEKKTVFDATFLNFSVYILY